MINELDILHKPNLVESNETEEITSLKKEINKLIRLINQYQKEISDNSWITNPDRMGGSFYPV